MGGSSPSVVAPGAPPMMAPLRGPWGSSRPKSGRCRGRSGLRVCPSPRNPPSLSLLFEAFPLLDLIVPQLYVSDVSCDGGGDPFVRIEPAGMVLGLPRLAMIMASSSSVALLLSYAESYPLPAHPNSAEALSSPV